MNELKDLNGVYMFKNEEAAKKVLNTMHHLAHWYGIVLRSDFKNLLNLETDSDDYKYGWTESMMQKVRIVPTELGYFIEFPKSIPLE